MPNFMLIRKTVLFFQSFKLDSATYSLSFEKALREPVTWDSDISETTLKYINNINVV